MADSMLSKKSAIALAGGRAFLCLLASQRRVSMTESTDTKLEEETIRRLQDMRRANEAICACVQILNDHGSNDGSIPSGASVFVRLDPNQVMGLNFAIEACSRHIKSEFDDFLEELGVYWLDEFSPDLNRQAEAVYELHNGEITFADFEKRVRK